MRRVPTRAAWPYGSNYIRDRDLAKWSKDVKTVLKITSGSLLALLIGGIAISATLGTHNVVDKPLERAKTG
jgi:hypothetical protein